MDLPAYKRISTTFAIGKCKYYGVGIASPQALYLIMTQSRNDLATGIAGGLGGLIGGLVAGAIAAVSARPGEAAHSCLVKDMPEGIRSNPDWPYGRRPKDEEKEVLVVPRTAVPVLEHPSFTNLLKFNIGNTAVRLEYLLMRGASIRDYLVAAGWAVKWRGELLVNAAQ